VVVNTNCKQNIAPLPSISFLFINMNGGQIPQLDEIKEQSPLAPLFQRGGTKKQKPPTISGRGFLLWIFGGAGGI
jgi:hypothetical protein